MDRSTKIKAQWAACALLLVFAVLSARLIHLYDTKYASYATLAARKHVRKEVIEAPRGDIVDLQGVPIAISRPLKVWVADGSLIQDPVAIADAVGDLLPLKREELLESLQTKRMYKVIANEIPEETAAEIQRRLAEKRLRGTHFEQSARRVYPNEEMLCHVVGYVNSRLAGQQGIESTMEKYLRGRDGFRFVERDRLGREIVPYRGQERPSRPGYNVRLTIDIGVQNIVEEELKAAYEKYKPETATALMMEPKTGRIMAMANFPNYNPNSREDKSHGEANNAVIGIVEPGSTFKIVTAAASLDDGDVTLSTVINIEGGRFHYGGGKPLKDHGRGPFPNLSVEDVLIRSSNIGVAKMALKMGENRFYHHLRNFGFGQRTGIALPGEVNGIMHAPGSPGWDRLTITRMPMGQGVATTPIQMVTAVSAVANGGELMMPQIVREIYDDEGKTMVDFEPVVVRRVVREETTRHVKRALAGVIGPRGTARQAAVKGYTVAGKTGTAQRAAKGGGYAKGEYVVSFIGFMPANEPRFVLLVMLDNCRTPHGSNYGGTIAAPVFARIAERTASYLGLQPDNALPEAPALRLTQASR